MNKTALQIVVGASLMLTMASQSMAKESDKPLTMDPKVNPQITRPQMQTGTVTGVISVLPGSGGPTGQDVKVTLTKQGSNQPFKTIQLNHAFPVTFTFANVPANVPFNLDFTYTGGWSPATSYPIKGHNWVGPVIVAPGQTLQRDMTMVGHPAD